jgi:hypothetical protein
VHDAALPGRDGELDGVAAEYDRGGGARGNRGQLARRPPDEPVADRVSPADLFDAPPSSLWPQVTAPDGTASPDRAVVHLFEVECPQYSRTPQQGMKQEDGPVSCGHRG